MSATLEGISPMAQMTNFRWATQGQGLGVEQQFEKLNEWLLEEP